MAGAAFVQDVDSWTDTLRDDFGEAFEAAVTAGGIRAFDGVRETRQSLAPCTAMADGSAPTKRRCRMPAGAATKRSTSAGP